MSQRASLVSSMHEVKALDCSHEINQLRVWLTKGKPELGWPGDPRLDIEFDVITAATDGTSRDTGKFYRKGDIVGSRIRVVRHNEDGTDKDILSRPSDEWYGIIPALAGNRIDSPGFKDPVTEIEAHNDKMRTDAAQKYAGAKREATEHLWRLVAERTTGLKGSFGRTPGTVD